MHIYILMYCRSLLTWLSFHFLYKLEQGESHSRNISRKSSLKSIPESEEEDEDDDKSENDDILTNNKKDLKNTDNQHLSKAYLDTFPCNKSFAPRTPPVVQVLSPGACTPNKSFGSEKSIINSCAELNTSQNHANENIKSDTTNIASLRSDVCTLTNKVVFWIEIYILNNIYIDLLTKNGPRLCTSILFIA